MADFEGLIRQALARQNDADPAIREKVYQSSRKALARMIGASGAQPPEVITRQQTALEASIRRIEAEYLARTPLRRPAEPRTAPAPRREAAAPPLHGPGVRGQGEGLRAGDEGVRGARQRPQSMFPELDTPDFADAYGDSPEMPDIPHAAQYDEPGIGRGRARRARGYEGHDYDADDSESTALRRIIAVLALIAILGVIGWLGYSLVTSVMGVLGSAQSEPPPAVTEPRNADLAERDVIAEDSSYITILSPTDTTALEIAGRGKAEIVSQSNLEMIRLVSLRNAGGLDEPAPPILIELGEGVLPRIAGKRITVEILAKSGSTGPASFAVGCAFDGLDPCGRKRFRVGIQPEAIVFTIDVDPGLATAESATLMISTDITSTAPLTGEGDAIDIVYARLRLPAD
ncbi:MAG: hypothetical protein VYD64_01990 [Pseudomonadota bacterium]|nr:hypothetical protein [Pseudomonadota bacterium]